TGGHGGAGQAGGPGLVGAATGVARAVPGPLPGHSRADSGAAPGPIPGQSRAAPGAGPGLLTAVVRSGPVSGLRTGAERTIATPPPDQGPDDAPQPGRGRARSRAGCSVAPPLAARDSRPAVPTTSWQLCAVHRCSAPAPVHSAQLPRWDR